MPGIINLFISKNKRSYKKIFKINFLVDIKKRIINAFFFHISTGKMHREISFVLFFLSFNLKQGKKIIKMQGLLSGKENKEKKNIIKEIEQ